MLNKFLAICGLVQCIVAINALANGDVATALFVGGLATVTYRLLD